MSEYDQQKDIAIREGPIMIKILADRKERMAEYDRQKDIEAEGPRASSPSLARICAELRDRAGGLEIQLRKAEQDLATSQRVIQLLKDTIETLKSELIDAALELEQARTQVPPRPEADRRHD